jgi:phenylacetate-CoA ligase
VTLRSQKAGVALGALERFFSTDLGEALARRHTTSPAVAAIDLFQEAARSVPAYGDFLREAGMAAQDVTSPAQWARVPVASKETYHRRHPLAALCRGGVLSDCDMLAVSSGSTGEPAIWPRFVSDELGSAFRFEQVLRDAFGAHQRRTLAVVCFALGSWVGGMYTTACLRHVAAKGYPLTVVTPGSQRPKFCVCYGRWAAASSKSCCAVTHRFSKTSSTAAEQTTSTGTRNR